MSKTVRLIALNVITSAVVTVATIFLMFVTLGIDVGLQRQPLAVSMQGLVYASSFPGANATEKLDKAIEASKGQRRFVIATPGIGLGAPSDMPDNITLVDLRQESVRILRRGFPLSDGSPQIFANEPNSSTLLVADSVPSNVSHEQDQAIAGLINNYSPNVNAVGVWGGARALAEGARVWGGVL